MSRRRSVPWIHRWSRQIIGAIAILGAILTAYLTVVKLTGNSVACTAGAAAASAASCNDVLSSPYATVLGLPLTLFGCLAYTSMATFALAPLAVNQEEKKELRSKLEDWTWLLLLAGATAMATFSGYLMYVLAFKLKSVCLYCIGSALFSLSLLTLSLIGRSWEDLGQIFFVGIVVVMVTLVSTLGVYSQVGGPTNRTPITLGCWSRQNQESGGKLPPLLAKLKLLWRVISNKPALRCTLPTGVPTATNKNSCLAKKQSANCKQLSVRRMAKMPSHKPVLMLELKLFLAGKLRGN
ncbi:MAG: vitamin K epoxide reductase family protein [Potamolinea sp.]